MRHVAAERIAFASTVRAATPLIALVGLAASLLCSLQPVAIHCTTPPTSLRRPHRTHIARPAPPNFYSGSRLQAIANSAARSLAFNRPYIAMSSASTSSVA
jgi:hypothetical protein